MRVSSALRFGSETCRRAGLDTPRLDAEVLLAGCLVKDRSWLYGYPEENLPPSAERCYEEWIRRRCSGEPVAYLSGEKEFMGLSFRVDPSVFVPRPETEELISRARALREEEGAKSLVDACTGSGNIAVAACLWAGFEKVAATEISPKALEVARDNALRLGAKVDFFAGNLLEPLAGGTWEGATDVVCANPPYIRRGDLSGLPAEVRREPRLALDGGDDGLALVRPLIRQSHTLLLGGGVLIMEIGEEQGRAVRDEAERAGFAEVSVERDHGGHDRYLVARKG